MKPEEFRSLVGYLAALRIPRPRSERELEKAVVARLTAAGYGAERQKVDRPGRLDVVVSMPRGGRTVVECKRTATAECFEQLDRYSTVSDGLLVVCWRATGRFKEVFHAAKAEIPVAFVELKRNAPMVG